MQPVDLTIENGYVITMDEQRRLLDRGTVVVDGTRIVDVGPAAELAGRYAPRTRIDATHKAVLPGLIDTHAHAGIAWFKDLMHLPGRKIRELVDHVVFRATGPEFWYAEGLLTGLERLKAGTTLGLFFCGGAPRADRPEPFERFMDGSVEVGVRSALAVGPARPPWPRTFSWWEDGKRTDYPVTMEGTFRVVGDLARRRQGDADGLVSVWLGASRLLGPSPFDVMFTPEHARLAIAQARRLDRAAKEYGLRFHTHGYDGAIAFVQREVSLLGSHVCLAHAQGLSDDEVRQFADTGASIAYCPAAPRNYLFAPARCPVPECLAAGVTVAIASDGPAPYGNLELFSQLRSALTHQRYALRAPRALTEGQALEMVTLHAARAMGVERELGSLTVGKRADVITIDLRSPRLLPRHLVPLRVVSRAESGDVLDVVVNGRLLMADRRVLSVDEARVLAFAEAQEALAVERSGIAPFLELPTSFWPAAPAASSPA